LAATASAAVLDIHGQKVPRITWRTGLFFGGDNVPTDQVAELRQRGLSQWWTHRRLQLIFGDEGTEACNISARELKCFTTNYMREHPIVYRVRYQQDSDKKLVDLRSLAGNLMTLLRRSKLDATMRQPRCYYVMRGAIVPTTVARLKLFQTYWEHGVIHAAIAHLPSVRPFKRRTNKVAGLLRQLQGGRRVQHREHDGPVRGGAVSRGMLAGLGLVEVRDEDALPLLHGTFAEAAEVVATRTPFGTETEVRSLIKAPLAGTKRPRGRRMRGSQAVPSACGAACGAASTGARATPSPPLEVFDTSEEVLPVDPKPPTKRARTEPRPAVAGGTREETRGEDAPWRGLELSVPPCLET